MESFPMSIAVNEANAWRLETPGASGWSNSPWPKSADKYLIISADGHANEPPMLWAERIDRKYRDRLPKVWTDDKGITWRSSEGAAPDRLIVTGLEGEDLVRSKAGAKPEDRLQDHALDGIDGEVIFPNKGMGMWYTSDPLFAAAQGEIYNTWAWELFGPYVDRLSPAAALATGDIPSAIAEATRCLKLGYRHLTLPCKPVFGPGAPGQLNYNSPQFDPFWGLVQEAGVPVTFHVSTGKDPRTTRGPGGAVINFAIHSFGPTMEPLVTLCASGVIERFPKLRFGTIEAGIGWIPWLLDTMDEGYRKHHMWVKPKLSMLPSEYFRANGFASFGEDRAGLELVESFGLQDNVLWANDYPHHEGTWPHSAQAIERTMGGVAESTRRKLLGENTARVFGFKELWSAAAARGAHAA